MQRGDRRALIFMGVIVVSCTIALFLPAVQEGPSQSGVSGALDMPAWMLVIITMGLAVLCAALIVVHHFRRRR